MKPEGSVTVPGDCYTAYGLSFRSEIAVPFYPAAPAGEPDVTVRLGPVPKTLNGTGNGWRPWQFIPGASLLDLDGVARYLVLEGREIVVEPTGGDEADLRTFLLGPVLGACLQQRGILTLHASAVETEAGAALFAGASGSGKSALLAALIDGGYRMLSDDVTGVVLDAAGRPVALPAFPSVKLWVDVVEALGWRARIGARVRKELQKFEVPVERFGPSPLPVRAVFGLRLHNRNTLEIDSVSAAAAFHLLLRCTYCRRFVQAIGGQAEHFRIAAALARQTPVSRVTRPRLPSPATALADAIEQHLRVASA